MIELFGFQWVEWSDLLLIFALAVSKAVQDFLAFEQPYEQGWLSVTWRWRDEIQWYDELGGWLSSPFTEAYGIRGFIADTVSTIGTNLQTIFSDAWHLMAACQAIAITALVEHAGLIGFVLILIFYSLSFEYALTILYRTGRKENAKIR